MFISRLFIYPIKSCAGTEVESLLFDRNGPVGDRRFLIVDPEGRFITQRECVAMARIQPELLDSGISLSAPGYQDFILNTPVAGERRRVTVWGATPEGIDCGDAVASWLEQVIGQPCRMVQLPDDNDRRVDVHYAPDETAVGYADGFPLLVVSQASLNALEVASGEVVDVRRFRPNILIDGADEPFVEQAWRRLMLQSGQVIQLVKPCERCVIPTRNPDSLQSTPAVTKAMARLCRMEGRIIFGQNAVFDGHLLRTGDHFEASE